MEPSSVAVAVNVTAPEGATVWLPCGLVMVTDGAWLPELTVMLTPDDVVVWPVLSVARAVMVCVPSGNVAVTE
jgi:hypothetical protein